MLSFPTQYDRKERVYISSGTEFEPTYQLITDDDGVQELTQVGKINTYERVQSWKESCDLKTILQRFANGDQNALNRNTPLFGDFLDMPNNLADYYKKIAEAEAVFYGLPVDVRAKFNHSPSEFFANIGSDRFYDILGYHRDPNPAGTSPSSGSVKLPEKEVSANE